MATRKSGGSLNITPGRRNASDYPKPGLGSPEELSSIIIRSSYGITPSDSKSISSSKKTFRDSDYVPDDDFITAGNDAFGGILY